MSHNPHHKFQALADRVRKHRLDQLHEIEDSTPIDTPFLARSRMEIYGKQIPLKFLRETKALEVFHQFDPKEREILWSYYSEDGKFLLQFGFFLEDHRYEVYTVHPSLFLNQQDMNAYLSAVQESLNQHYPPLMLTKTSGGQVNLERRG